jgi:adenine deaminase
LEKLRLCFDNAVQVPFNFIFGAPPCVPATPFEATGIAITDDDIDKLFHTGKVCYLSGMMNFPGVIHISPYNNASCVVFVCMIG